MLECLSLIALGVLIIVLFKKVIIGYTVETDPFIWEKSTVKITKADKTKNGWLVTGVNGIEYRLSRSAGLKYDVPENGCMYFERSFQNPCVIRKRWLRGDKIQYGPFELVQTLHLHSSEKSEKF